MSSFLLSEANKLKNMQIFLEKNDNLVSYLAKYGGESDLYDVYKNLEEQRRIETEKLNTEIKDIWQSLRAKKNLLKRGDVDNLDLKLFKKDMIELQEKIQNMKIKVKFNFESLKDQEKEYWQIMEAYNQKVPEWERHIKCFSSFNYKVNSSISTYNDNKEIKEFMDFVKRSNGHENGWSSEDHHLFLKLRNKYKNIDNLAINLNKLLPDISIDDIKKHDIWYRKYLSLKSKKEEALERWRQTKKENIHHETVSDNRNIIKDKKIFTIKDENIKEKLALWKAEKEAKRQQEKEFEQINKERMKHMQTEKRKFFEEVKKSVAKWKETKLLKEQNAKLEKEFIECYEKKLRATTANKMIKQFQSQDDIFIMKMKNSKQKEKNEVKRSKSSYVVNRDPERIFKPTKQWLFRTAKDSISGDAAKFVPNIREVPKLRIPEWRKHTLS